MAGGAEDLDAVLQRASEPDTPLGASEPTFEYDQWLERLSEGEPKSASAPPDSLQLQAVIAATHASSGRRPFSPPVVSPVLALRVPAFLSGKV